MAKTVTSLGQSSSTWMIFWLEARPRARSSVTNLKDLFDFGKWVEMTGKQNMMYCGGLLETVGPDVILSFGA